MLEKTQIEKIVDAIEAKDRLKNENLDVIKENRKEEWNKELEDSPYNTYFGVDIKCAVAIMKAMQKGLEAKDAVYVSEHHFKVPAERTGDLIYKYSEDGEEMYDEIVNVQRIGYCKKLINSRKDY